MPVKTGPRPVSHTPPAPTPAAPPPVAEPTPTSEPGEPGDWVALVFWAACGLLLTLLLLKDLIVSLFRW